MKERSLNNLKTASLSIILQDKGQLPQTALLLEKQKNISDSKWKKKFCQIAMECQLEKAASTASKQPLCLVSSKTNQGKLPRLPYFPVRNRKTLVIQSEKRNSIKLMCVNCQKIVAGKWSTEFK